MKQSSVKSKSKKSGLSGFAEPFPKENLLSDRRLGMAGYVDNIATHHIESCKGAINGVYESRIGCKVFKD